MLGKKANNAKLCSTFSLSRTALRGGKLDTRGQIQRQNQMWLFYGESVNMHVWVAYDWNHNVYFPKNTYNLVDSWTSRLNRLVFGESDPSRCMFVQHPAKSFLKKESAWDFAWKWVVVGAWLLKREGILKGFERQLDRADTHWLGKVRISFIDNLTKILSRIAFDSEM